MKVEEEEEELEEEEEKLAPAATAAMSRLCLWGEGFPPRGRRQAAEGGLRRVWGRTLRLKCFLMQLEASGSCFLFSLHCQFHHLFFILWRKSSTLVSVRFSSSLFEMIIEIQSHSRSQSQSEEKLQKSWRIFSILCLVLFSRAVCSLTRVFSSQSVALRTEWLTHCVFVCCFFTLHHC